MSNRLFHEKLDVVISPVAAKRVFPAILYLLLSVDGSSDCSSLENALKESEHPCGPWTGRQDHVPEVLDFVSKGRATLFPLQSE